MKEKKRNSYEIIIKILQSLLDGPLNKTRISFRSNLDTRLTNQYLGLLLSSGLIEKNDNSDSLYRITLKGLMFRNKFFEFETMLKSKQNEDAHQVCIIQEEFKPKNNIYHSKLRRDFDPSKIFQVDKSIRFVGVCSKNGNLLEAEYRTGINPLISDNELQIAAMKSALRYSMRQDDEKDIGKIQYSVTSYENVKRVTIPFEEGLLLLISFERHKNEVEMISKIFDVVFDNSISNLT